MMLSNLTASPARKLAWGVVLLALMLVVVFVASPAARAGVLEIIREVGGLAFEETDQYPFGDVVETAMPWQTVSLPEAQAMIPFTLTLPTWAPDGLVLQENVDLLLPTDDVLFTIVLVQWCPPGSSYNCIQMAAECPAKPVGGSSFVVGTGSVEEAEINGYPAALVQGAWNADTQQYDDSFGLSLMWKRGGVTYSLTDADGQADDLIRMAESMPVVEAVQCPAGEATLPEPTPVTISEAQAVMSFTLPTWAPEGFVLQEDKVLVTTPLEGEGAASVLLAWNKSGTDFYILLSVDVDLGQPGLMGPVEEVIVNGQSAALVRGEFRVLSQRRDYPMALQWRQDGVIYTLIGGEGGVSAGDLIRMAESMP